MPDARAVTVLGAGIAGLSVATALARFGAHPRILEQAPSIREVGAGLQITPNGMAVLRALGLGSAAEEVSQAAEGVELIDGESGQIVTRIDFTQIAPAGSFRFFHRADLIMILEKAARSAGVSIALNCKVSTVQFGDHTAQLQTAHGFGISKLC